MIYRMNACRLFEGMRKATLVLSFGFVVACAAPEVKTAGNPTAPSLAGTTWQLVAIRSMDDAQGTTLIAEPVRFTLQFDKDGQVRLRLDCNRGTGSYMATPVGDGHSGLLTFGPMATTRAMCPPPPIDTRLIRQLPYVRSYLLKDGKLYLSLMADGGIYEWAPHK